MYINYIGVMQGTMGYKYERLWQTCQTLTATWRRPNTMSVAISIPTDPATGQMHPTLTKQVMLNPAQAFNQIHIVQGVAPAFGRMSTENGFVELQAK
jgi:hypothetical protein